MTIETNDKLLSSNRHRCRPRVLYAATGSVAAVKGPEIAVRLVNEFDLDVRILLTRGGENFWNKARDYDPKHWELMQSLSTTKNPRVSICTADDEWKEWNKLGDPVLHIDLRDWADILLVAPLSAHTLAKISHGFCDDTLSCVIRAWDFGHGPRPGKPLLLAPAMNTAMWDHPLTQTQLSAVKGFSNTAAARDAGRGSKGDHDDANARANNTDLVRVISPQVKTLACGEIGNGALAPVDEILRAVSDALSEEVNNENFPSIQS